MSRQPKHARQTWTGIVVMQGNLVLMSTVNHPPNCSTQCFLKVMIACKNVSTAVAASSAPPMKSSRNRATTPSSSSNTGGEACAAGRHATAMRKALRCSYAGQCSNTWCIDSMLSASSQAGHMRSSVSWLGWSLYECLLENILMCPSTWP
jgi:hypothetical protein